MSKRVQYILLAAATVLLIGLTIALHAALNKGSAQTSPANEFQRCYPYANEKLTEYYGDSFRQAEIDLNSKLSIVMVCDDNFIERYNKRGFETEKFMEQEAERILSALEIDEQENGPEAYMIGFRTAGTNDTTFFYYASDELGEHTQG